MSRRRPTDAQDAQDARDTRDAEAPAATFAIEDVGPDAAVVLLGRRPQSHVDLGDPTRLVFDYVRRLGDALDAVAPPGEPLRVLHVGGAGLTLPRYVAATRTGSKQVVLEPDAALTALVRARLPLPRGSGISVRPVDGLDGLGDVRDGWAQALVLDAYDLDGSVPAHLLSAQAVAADARVLAPEGLLAVNLADAPPYEATRSLLALLRTHLGPAAVTAEPATLRGRRPGNLLLLAGRDPARTAALVDALRERAASRAAPYRVLDPRQAQDRFGGG